MGTPQSRARCQNGGKTEAPEARSGCSLPGPCTGLAAPRPSQGPGGGGTGLSVRSMNEHSPRARPCRHWFYILEFI